MRKHIGIVVLIGVLFLTCAAIGFSSKASNAQNVISERAASNFDETTRANYEQTVSDGRETFRFDTFGDEAFWGDTLQLHKTIEGANLGGVGPGVSPRTALAVGLKVDVDALPAQLVQGLKNDKVNLDDPATTLASAIEIKCGVRRHGPLQRKGHAQRNGHSMCLLPLYR